MALYFGENEAEMKKHLYRKCFEETDVIGRLTEILEKLMSCDVKPENPMDFIRTELGFPPIPHKEIDRLEHEFDEAQRELRRLRCIMRELGLNDTTKGDDKEIRRPGPEAFSN